MMWHHTIENKRHNINIYKLKMDMSIKFSIKAAADNN